MPSRIVSHRPFFSPSRSPWISEWCAQVTVVPEHSRISVLSSGSAKGSSTASIAAGGKRPPTTSVRALGNSAKSNHAQNQPTKNITSEAMNRIIP
jgi:hypothetical protein